MIDDPHQETAEIATIDATMIDIAPLVRVEITGLHMLAALEDTLTTGIEALNWSWKDIRENDRTDGTIATAEDLIRMALVIAEEMTESLRESLPG